MIALLSVELEKILRRRLNQVVLAIFLSLLVLVYVLLWLASDVVSEVGAGDPATIARIRASLYLQETVPFAMLMLYTFGFAAGVVVVGANVGSEYGWNTIRTLTAAEPRRWRVLLAKYVALAGIIVAALLLGLAVTLVTSALITLSAGEFDLGFVDGPYLRDSAYAFLRLLVGTSPYLGLAALLGVYGRSATAGIALALGVAFLEGIVGGLMSLAGGWVADIPKYMLDTNGDTLAIAGGGAFGELFGGDSPLAQAIERPSVRHAVTVLLCWATAFVATSFWVLRKQDLGYEG